MYADDLDFDNEKDENAEIIVQKMKNVQSEQIFIVKESKNFVSTQMSNPMQKSSDVCRMGQRLSTNENNWLVLLRISTENSGRVELLAQDIKSPSTICRRNPF